MNDGNEQQYNGKNGMKLGIAIGSLSVIYLAPYLNITSISLNMDLLETVGISALFLGFWTIATLLLRSHNPNNKKESQPKILLRKHPITS